MSGTPRGTNLSITKSMGTTTIPTMQAFYRDFSEKFVDVFRDRWIICPTNALEAADKFAVYGRLGFPKAIGSVDCTHVYWGRCPALFQGTFSGKEKKLIVAYKVTVNHSCRVLYISAGHPGSRNDKTIVKTDKLVMDLKEKKILQDVEYNLFKGKHIITMYSNALYYVRPMAPIVSVRGAYLIIDNGSAKWRIMQCPIKFSTNENELRWSTRLESVRKDIECFFGRLKARFRILHMRCGPKGVGGLVEEALRVTGVGLEAVYGVRYRRDASNYHTYASTYVRYGGTEGTYRVLLQQCALSYSIRLRHAETIRNILNDHTSFRL